MSVDRCENYKALDSAKRSSKELALEIECLRDELESLGTTVSDLRGEMNELKSEQNKLGLDVNVEMDRLQDRTLVEASLHKDYMNAQQAMMNSLHSTYGNWSVGLTIIIGLAGLLALYTVSKYRQREIDKIADDAQSKVQRQFEDNELLANAVASSFEHEKVQKMIEKMKNELLRDQESNVRAIVEDMQGESYVTQLNDDAEANERGGSNE